MATQLASDIFQRANENPLSGGGNWTTVHGDGALQIVSDVCEASTGANRCGAFYSGISWPNDQYSEITIGSLTTNDELHAIVRCAPNAATYYLVKYENPGLFLHVVNAGSINPVATSGAFSGSVGDKLRLQAKGTTISVLWNGVQQLSVTDSTIASGSAGLRISAPLGGISSDQITAWAGGGFGPPVPTIPNDLDRGHVFDGVLYFGTLHGWAGRTGYITPDTSLGDTAFPIAHTGEVASARANIDDFSFVPVNGQRVQFYMLRDSAGDKLAISIAAL